MPRVLEWWRAAGKTWHVIGNVVAVAVSIAGAAALVVGFIARSDGLPVSTRLTYGSLVFGAVTIALCGVASVMLYFAGVGPGRGYLVPSVMLDDRRRARVLIDVLERYMDGLGGITNSFRHASLPRSHVNDLRRTAYDLAEAARDCIRADGVWLGPARLFRYDSPHPEVSLIRRDGWSKNQARANVFAETRRAHLENFIDELRAHLRE